MLLGGCVQCHLLSGQPQMPKLAPLCLHGLQFLMSLQLDHLSEAWNDLVLGTHHSAPCLDARKTLSDLSLPSESLLEFTALTSAIETLSASTVPTQGLDFCFTLSHIHSEQYF